MARALEGGCFCGEVRYRISGKAVLQLFCFCRDCRATTGTDAYAGYMVKDDDFELLSGNPARHERDSREGRKVVRRFCATCGSNLWGETELGLTSIAAGTLDDPDVFEPGQNVFVEDAPHWARIPRKDNPPSASD